MNLQPLEWCCKSLSYSYKSTKGDGILSLHSPHSLMATTAQRPRWSEGFIRLLPGALMGAVPSSLMDTGTNTGDRTNTLSYLKVQHVSARHIHQTRYYSPSLTRHAFAWVATPQFRPHVLIFCPCCNVSIILPR
jgi:hypothetical protein